MGWINEIKKMLQNLVTLPLKHNKIIWKLAGCLGHIKKESGKKEMCQNKSRSNVQYSI